VHAIGTTFTAWMYNWQVPWRMDLESIPDPYEITRHILICIVCEDFCFHIAHRLFHCKNKRLPLYQWFHKQHHEFQHPVSICSEYCHPVEFLVSNHYPSFVGMFLLGSKCHFWTIMLWGVIRVLESHDAHSGYEFPWSIFRIIPFNSDATYHIFHHTKNVGNYSSFMTIWDTVFDSNKEFYEQYPEGSRIE
jgi:sterol desaturase/sphingolipid hydroxylase (fatty acid hydroxylase superfamily)